MMKALILCKQIVLFLTKGGVALCCGCFVLSLFGRMHWGLELLSHFTMQYVVTLMALGVVLVIGRSWKWGGVAFITALLATWGLLPYYTTPRDECFSEGKALNIATFNVLASNSNHSEVLSALSDINADVLFFMEVNKEWASQLEVIQEDYPYSLTNPREDNFGVALYSKIPFVKSQIEYFGELPAAHIQVENDGEVINLLGIHPLPPMGEIGSLRRNQHLKEVGEFINEVDGEVVLMGDLNTTPFSHVFKDFLTNTQLRDSALGFGINATWNRNVPMIAIPIDHILVSQKLLIKDRKVLGNYGSDHSLVFASLCNKEIPR